MKFANPPKAFCSIAKIIAGILCGRREEKKITSFAFFLLPKIGACGNLSLSPRAMPNNEPNQSNENRANQPP